MSKTMKLRFKALSIFIFNTPMQSVSAVLLHTQVLGKFLDLHVDEMMEELTGRVLEEDEEKKKMQIPQQFKNKTGLFKQSSPDSTVSAIQRGGWRQS